MKAQHTLDWLLFLCPGCDELHRVRVSGEGAAWTWNGEAERPTLSPSVLVRSGHYIPTLAEDDPRSKTCWCTYNAEHPDDPAPFKCVICHSFVVDGRIEFLGDSTHALAGQTIDLPEWEPR